MSSKKIFIVEMVDKQTNKQTKKETNKQTKIQMQQSYHIITYVMRDLFSEKY